MIETLICVIAGVLFLFLLFNFLLPRVIKHLEAQDAKEFAREHGPWLVRIEDEFLMFLTADRWSTTSLSGNAEWFNDRQQASEWAVYTKGVVVPLSEVGK